LRSGRLSGHLQKRRRNLHRCALTDCPLTTIVYTMTDSGTLSDTEDSLLSLGADFAYRLGVALWALELWGLGQAWDDLAATADVWAWGEATHGK